MGSGRSAPFPALTALGPAGHGRPVGRAGWRKRALPLLFFAPAVLLVAGVNLYPAAYGIAESLFRTSYAERVGFIGGEHYLRLIHDDRVLNAARTSVIYVTGSVAISILAGLALALLLARPWPLRNLFRTILLTPWVISQTVAALLWGWLLNPLYGPITYGMSEVGIRGLDLLGNPNSSLPTVILINAWRSFPLAMILLLAALQTIPDELIEAAKIDGASTWQTFRFVTFPLITRTLTVTAISLTIYSFGMVTLVYTLTGGGPLGMTETLSVLAFQHAFTDWQLGYAAAIGVVIFVLNIVFGIAYVQVLKGRRT